MISFMEPMGLAALAALAVPVLIHLVRRSDRRIVAFAALRFLAERTHPRREWQLHRRLLLGLRLMLIAGLALLLTMPVWRGSGKPKPPWYVVAPGAEVGGVTASPHEPGAEWHWLAAGFPPLTTPHSPEPAPVASLLRQLDGELPSDTPVTAVVPATLGGLDGERVRLGRAVQWRVVPGSSPTGRVTPPAAPPLEIAVRLDAAGAAELPVARALAAAWAAGGTALRLDVAGAGAPLSDATWLIWLGGPLSTQAMAWVRRGGIALASRAPPDRGEPVLTDADGSVVFRESPVGHGRIVSIAAPLIPGRVPALLQPELAARLHAVMAAPRVPPDRAAAQNAAPLRRGGQAAGPTRSLASGVAVCAALLFLIERWWATRRVRLRLPGR